MALGDGSGWDQTNPTNATDCIYIDDHIVDLRKGVAGRMNLEHEWPGSQSATSEAGMHKYMTLQMQSTHPTLAGTQVAAAYAKTVATTGDAFFYVNAATKEINLSDRTYFWYIDGPLATGTNASAKLRIMSDGDIKVARALVATTASGTGAGIQIDVLYDGASIWTATANQLLLAMGSTSTEVAQASIATHAVTAGGYLTIDLDTVGDGTAGSNLTVMVEVG